MKRIVEAGLFSIAILFVSPFAARATDTSGVSLAPVLAAREGWINRPVAGPDLENKVVLVDVFTFGCSNCQNVLPNLKKLETSRRADLVIVGVHSPETPYETTRSNVVANLKQQGITWPVALDNSFAIWKAYGVTAWPTQMLFDRHGRLRKTVVGDSQDRELDTTVDALISEK